MCSKEGFPSVRVPVLSVMRTFTLFIISKASAFFIRTPFLAPFPIPTIRLIGVASPKAHGHAMIRTATAFPKAINNEPFTIHQMINVSNEIATTEGTKILATLSVNFCIGALLLLASFTILMI